MQLSPLNERVTTTPTPTPPCLGVGARCLSVFLAYGQISSFLEALGGGLELPSTGEHKGQQPHRSRVDDFVVSSEVRLYVSDVQGKRQAKLLLITT